MSKAKAQKKHAIRRMNQRTNIQMSKGKYEQLCQVVRASAKNGGVLYKQTRRTRLIKVNFEGENIIVVYDVKRKTVVTVLPREDEYYSIFKIV